MVDLYRTLRGLSSSEQAMWLVRLCSYSEGTGLLPAVPFFLGSAHSFYGDAS